MTFDKKILSGFSACALILLIVSVFSVRNSARLGETNDLVNHTYEVIMEFDQVLLMSINAETGMRGYIITGNEIFLQPYNDARVKSTEHMNQALTLTRTNPQQQLMLRQLRELLDRHFEYLEHIISIRKKSNQQANEIVSGGEGKRTLDAIRATVNNAKSLQQQLLADRKEASDDEARTFTLLFVGLLCTIVLALVIIYFIIRSNINALRKAEAEASEKNWSLSGSSDLVKSVQGNKTTAEIAQIIVDHMAAYLKVPVGALYVAEHETLYLAGAHALDKKERKMRFGEGLVGQAAASKSTLLVDALEQHDFTVGTTFGAIQPKTIISVPFTLDEEVIGVIELGALQPFTDVQKRYLDFVSGSIAIAILSAKVRAEARELLEETQRQAEELEAQQAELRQTNEELHTKTDLLERSELELKAQQAELQEINAELEEKANMLEDQKGILEIANQDIEKKAREIEVTSKYKSEFLANMSHELRTPLNSILILSQLLSENKHKTLANKDVEYARNIFNSGSDLLNLINEILDLSKIEAGKMQLDIDETPVQEIIETIASVFSEMAIKNSIEFTIDAAEPIRNRVITTDKQRAEQILKNLLSNAFKFTPANGKVTLAIRETSGQNPASRGLSFSVTDTGIGIPKEKLEIIFEAFQQADGSTKRKYGGTGLGLSISRELALALGGSVSVESRGEGSGSTFTLNLPYTFNASMIAPIDKTIELKEVDRAKPAEMKKSTHRPILENLEHDDDRESILEHDKVILIIEDEPQFAQVLLDFIRERNYKGIIASQGNTGISFARHYKPVAIFLDINLPVMDGIEVLKQIKNDPDLRHIPVQIISAYDQKKKGLELGAFDFIRKPVTTQDLQHAFNKIESFKSKKMKRLLIVEDNKLQNSAIRELIGNGDVKCSSAYKGLEAYEMLHQDTFDCVIVDLGLPDMSGIELLEKIKSNEQLNRIPIIVYTGKDLKKEELNVLNKLADTVVLKTADSRERLLDEAMLFLHRMESKLPKDKQNIIRKLHRSDELLRGRKVLLVDDDIRNIYSLTNALEEEGVQCITAENGKQAIEVLRNDPKIELVLMDIMMPEMDGYEATMEIRKSEKHQKLPIIALTAKAMKGDKEKCLAAGMSDYISKPVNVDQLVSLMRVWLYK